MTTNVYESKQRLEDYLKTNTKIYPIEIARILGVGEDRAIRLYRAYRKITGDNKLPSVNARLFFEMYWHGDFFRVLQNGKIRD